MNEFLWNIKVFESLGLKPISERSYIFCYKICICWYFFEIKSLLNQLGLVVSLAIMASFGINGLSRKIIFYLGGQLGFRILYYLWSTLIVKIWKLSLKCNIAKEEISYVKTYYGIKPSNNCLFSFSRTFT